MLLRDVIRRAAGAERSVRVPVISWAALVAVFAVTHPPQRAVAGRARSGLGGSKVRDGASQVVPPQPECVTHPLKVGIDVHVFWKEAIKPIVADVELCEHGKACEGRRDRACELVVAQRQNRECGVDQSEGVRKAAIESVVGQGHVLEAGGEEERGGNGPLQSVVAKGKKPHLLEALPPLLRNQALKSIAMQIQGTKALHLAPLLWKLPPQQVEAQTELAQAYHMPQLSRQPPPQPVLARVEISQRVHVPHGRRERPSEPVSLEIEREQPAEPPRQLHGGGGGW
mmetsp:Transcript_24064/g.59373  ORF Transcript_24064/g.59373 Transcript_24064/m.59373 type:complete len:284 (-) Transcript_24064:8-859(-)